MKTFIKYSFLKNQKFKKLKRKKENKSKKLQTYLKLPYIKNLNIHLSIKKNLLHLKSLYMLMLTYHTF